MACSQPSGTTKGIVIAYQPTDTGDRPLAAGTAFWESPNIRFALTTDVAGLMNPANWDPPNAQWNGQVDVGSAYTLLVRIRNTDPNQARTFLHLDGWVSDYTLGGVGPGSAIAGPTGPVTFSGADDTNTLPPAKANPNDPTGMLVLKGDPPWTPTPTQAAINGGHVCVGGNVYAEQGEGTPADGQQLIGNFIDPACDRMYGQHNVQIVTAKIGQRVQFPIMLLVPATDRCPLHARVAIRRVDLEEGPDGALQRVHALGHAARIHALTRLGRPDGDPLGNVRIGHEGSSGGNNVRLHLEPGERADLTITLDPAKNQKPGDAYAFDMLTTDTATDRLFGAARVYVLVTA